MKSYYVTELPVGVDNVTDNNTDTYGLFSMLFEITKIDTDSYIHHSIFYFTISDEDATALALKYRMFNHCANRI